MNADKLFSGKFAGWMTPSAPPLWLFVHVPKTAGSSLVSDIAEMLPPYKSLHIDHLNRAKPGPEQFDDVVSAFLVENQAKPFRFASGHVLHRHWARIVQAVPGTRLFTMLREPVARLVSDYLYQRSSMHPLHEEVRAKVPSFDAFLELKGPRNRQARHLVPKRMIDAGDVAGGIDFLRKRYAFVGIQERYDLGFRALTTLLGQPARPAARKRVNDESAEEKAEALARAADPAVRARMLELNAMDFALYDHAAAAWAEIAAPLEKFLDRQEARAA
jgi:hypothetical protein